MSQSECSGEVQVRIAEPNDALAIAGLNRDVQAVHAALEPTLFKPPGLGTFGAEDAAAILASPHNIVFLAVIEEMPIGYAYAEIRRRAENAYAYAYDEVYLHHLSVTEACRRQGVGRALLAAVWARANALGIGRLALDVWSANTAAREFFRSQGFAPYNERMARGGWKTGSINS